MSPTSPKAQISTCSPPSVHTSTHYHHLLGVKRPQSARRFRALAELLGPLRSRRDAAGAGTDAARPAARGGADIGTYSFPKAQAGSFSQPPGRKVPAGACAGGSRVTPGGGQVVRAARARRSRCRWAPGAALG